MGWIALDRNVAQDKIHLFLDDIVFKMKEMNGRLKEIKASVAPGNDSSCHSPTDPVPIEVDASTSS